MALTEDQEDAINTKIGEMNNADMEERLDELDGIEELTEEQQYEYDEIESRLDDLNEDDEGEIGPHDVDKEEADKDN